MLEPLARRLAAETLGTGLLLATVIGSGIMGEKLSGGNDAIALLGNTLPTGAILIVLITIFGPISGAHFNPVVSLAMAVRGQLGWADVVPYLLAQVIGGVLGVLAAHLMFELALFQISTTVRSGPGQWAAEAIATFGLLLTIFGTLRAKPDFVATAVGLYITAAYWFTASTSFANPAVTLARTLSDTFAGIGPADAPGFILSQIAGAAGSVVLAGWLFPQTDRSGD